MKALVLVGGYGTRLRPLTLSLPKPLIAFCNRTIVEHQIEALVAAGVQHVILAVAYRPDAMQTALESLERRLSVKISCSQETEPLGTAGPIKLAESLLMTPDDGSSKTEADILEESFFVCNSDIICEFPLDELKRFHYDHGKEGTILVTEVQDPSKFGVVVAKANGDVERFVEKPSEYVGNTINAGFYILKKKIIRRIEERPTSIERETFPLIAEANQLAAMKISGYWADIGQPNSYLSGVKLHLDFLRRKSLIANEKDLRAPDYSPTGSTPITTLSNTLQSLDSSPLEATFADHPLLARMVDSNNEVLAHSRKLAVGKGIIENVLIHPTVKIGKGCNIGPDVTVSAGSVIGNGVRLKNCAVMEGVVVGDNSCLLDSIIGWKCKIGKWVRMENLTVLGEDVDVAQECFVNGALVLPHKHIKTSVYDVGQILM